MTLSVDDDLTLVEVAVILIGIAIAWAAYHGAGEEEVEAPGPRAIPAPQGEVRSQDAGDRRVA